MTVIVRVATVCFLGAGFLAEDGLKYRDLPEAPSSPWEIEPFDGPELSPSKKDSLSSEEVCRPDWKLASSDRIRSIVLSTSSPNGLYWPGFNGL